VPTICQFVAELHTSGSPSRESWVAASTKPDKNPRRKKVALDFGLSGKDLRMCEKAIDDDDGRPVEDHCGLPHGTWVR
jgi:hypothetical protein